MSKNDSSLTCERLKEVLHYDPISGVFRWRIRPCKNMSAGSIAGSIGKNGYTAITVDKVRYMAHRLAWFYVHDVWPTHDIDHLNGQPIDNRLTNLRDVPRSVNMQNQRGPRSNNQSGFLGVIRRPSSFHAAIRFDGTLYHIGVYPTAELAYEAYLGAKRLFHPGCTI